MPNPLTAIGISSSPTPGSRSRKVMSRVLELIAGHGVETSILDLADLPADALLARRTDPVVADAVAACMKASILVLATPTYRATYAGQLKAFMDLFPHAGLTGIVVGAVATAGGPMHLLLLDHGIRPLVASLGGLTASQLVYVTDSELPSGAEIGPELDKRLAAMAGELVTLAGRARS